MPKMRAEVILEERISLKFSIRIRASIEKLFQSNRTFAPLMVGDTVLITDERGRRYLARLDEKEMIPIRSLGTIRSDHLRSSLESGRLAIGRKSFAVRKASTADVIAHIERRAQVITSKDIALIVHYCDIRCGSKVIEGGAGSGALTIALLSNVGESGSVTTYEIREEFAAIARKNVALAGLSANWTLKMADICSSIDESDIDAIVIDIPNPWDCVESSAAALRMGGSFCAFIPSTNQVESTVRGLDESAFGDIMSFETLQREMVVHDKGIRPSFDMLGHTGYLVIARRVKWESNANPAASQEISK